MNLYDELLALDYLDMESPQPDGSWAVYQKLVLVTLENHSQSLATIDAKLGELLSAYTATRSDVDRMGLQVVRHEERLDTLEKESVSARAVKRYRDWLVGGAIAVAAIVIPAVIKVWLGV